MGRDDEDVPLERERGNLFPVRSEVSDELDHPFLDVDDGPSVRPYLVVEVSLRNAELPCRQERGQRMRGMYPRVTGVAGPAGSFLRQDGGPPVSLRVAVRMPMRSGP